MRGAAADSGIPSMPRGLFCDHLAPALEMPRAAAYLPAKSQFMTVDRLFKNKAFEPEAIAAMSRAYAEVCETLGVNDDDRRETSRVAKTVIEFAQRGARDAGRLRDCVLQALRD